MTSRGSSKNNNFWQLLLLALVLAFTANTTWAQDAAEDEEEDDVRLDRVVVTGSRIKRGDLEGPAPITIIDQQEMNERGYTTVFEALSDLSINNGWKVESPERTNGFAPDTQTINLRGFGVGTTLTLINGRRLANYPAAYNSNTTVFSFSAIPVAAIERIEIMSTGASAIYGSDAVAGVVNIILRSDIDETTVNVLWGSPTETNSTRGDTRIQLVNGKTFDRGSYTFTGEYLDRKSILGGQYDAWDNEQDDFPYGQGVYIRNLMHFDNFRSAFGEPERYVDPAELTGREGDAACGEASGAPTYAFREGAGHFCTNTASGAPQVNFRNAKESISLYFNGRLELGDGGTELFTDLLYYKADTVSNGQFVSLVEDILDVTQPDTIGFGFFDWWTMFRRFTQDDVGLDMNLNMDDEAYTIVGGARGVFRDLHDWEVSANYSKSTFESRQPWLKWRETIDTFLGTWHGVSFFGDDWWSGGTLGEDMPFGIGLTDNHFGTANDAVKNAFGMQTYGNETTDLFLQFTMNGDLMEMRSGPLSYAVVAEYEDEDLTFIPDDLIQQPPPDTDVNGDPITGLTGSGWYRLTGYDGAGDRERYSIGGEVRIPLHETFIANLALRYDHYDSISTSIGGDVMPSASFEWRPVDNLLVRAGYTQSFRAPDMAQVFVRTGFFQTVTDWISCYEQYVFVNGNDDGFDTADCDGTGIFARRVGPQDFGGEPLDAETGDNWWVGFSWDVTDNLSMTVDYTNFHLEQRINQQSTQGLLNDEWACFNGDSPQNTPCEQVSQQIQRLTDPLTNTSFIDNMRVTSINQFEEDAEFIDVRIVYLLNTEAGQFRFQGDYNNMLSHTQRLTPESEEDDVKNDPITGGWDFRSSFIGSVTWAYRDFSTTLTGIYRGGTTVRDCSSATNGCVGNVTDEDYYATENWWIDPYVTWNFTAAYNWTDAFLARLRVVNLFDEDPPWDDTHDFFQEPWYNAFVYPGAGIGRYAAIELEYTWQ